MRDGLLTVAECEARKVAARVLRNFDHIDNQSSESDLMKEHIREMLRTIEQGAAAFPHDDAETGFYSSLYNMRQAMAAPLLLLAGWFHWTLHTRIWSDHDLRLRLGNATTSLSLTASNQITLERRSTAGFTAAELHLLSDWLESPDFPRGLYSTRSRRAASAAEFQTQ